MHNLFALFVAVALALTTATAHADELPIADPPRQQRGRVKTVTGSIFLGVGLTSLVMFGSAAAVGFRNWALYGADGDVFATVFLALGTAEAVVGTAVGVPLLAVGYHEQKPLASPTSVATIRF